MADAPVCDECGSPFRAEATAMESLCAECAHLLYGKPPCAHVFVDGACQTCGWSGARSVYTAGLAGSE